MSNESANNSGCSSSPLTPAGGRTNNNTKKGKAAKKMTKSIKDKGKDSPKGNGFRSFHATDHSLHNKTISTTNRGAGMKSCQDAICDVYCKKHKKLKKMINTLKTTQNYRSNKNDRPNQWPECIMIIKNIKTY